MAVIYHRSTTVLEGPPCITLLRHSSIRGVGRVFLTWTEAGLIATANITRIDPSGKVRPHYKMVVMEAVVDVHFCTRAG